MKFRPIASQSISNTSQNLDLHLINLLKEEENKKIKFISNQNMKLKNSSNSLSAVNVNGNFKCVSGLNNLGNTCFFNSILQNLAQSPFLEDLLSESLKTSNEQLLLKHNDDYDSELTDYDEENDHENETTTKSGEVKEHAKKAKVEPVQHRSIRLNEITLTIKEPHGNLTRCLFESIRSMTGSYSVFNPNSLFYSLCKRVPSFKGYQQQDSHELLRNLLDAVKTEELKRRQAAILELFKVNKSHGIDDLIKRKIKRYGRLASYTIIDKLFGGHLLSTIVCEECKNCTQRVEPFLDLSLPICDEVKSSLAATSLSFASNLTSFNNKFKNNFKSSKNSKYQSNKADKFLKEKEKENVNENNNDDDYQLEDTKKDATTKNQIKKQKKLNKKQRKALKKLTKTETNEENGSNNEEEDHKEGEEQDDEKSVISEKINESGKVVQDSQTNMQELSSDAKKNEENEEIDEKLEEDETEDLEESSKNIEADDLSSKNELNTVKHINSARDQTNDIEIKFTKMDLTDTSNNDSSIKLKPARPNMNVKHDEYLRNEFKLQATKSLSCVSQHSFESGSVQACLAKFTSKETLSDKLHCEKCSRHNNQTKTYAKASKQYLICDMPAILTIHLKRFQQHGSRLEKLNKHVNFPLILDMSPYVSSQAINLLNTKNVNKKIFYSLYGVVEHSGKLNSGHYTAYVKAGSKSHHANTAFLGDQRLCHLNKMLKKYLANDHKNSIDDEDDEVKVDECEVLEEIKESDLDLNLANNSNDLNNNDTSDESSQKWYYISDSHVTEVNVARVLKCQAYIVFYERIQ